MYLQTLLLQREIVYIQKFVLLRGVPNKLSMVIWTIFQIWNFYVISSLAVGPLTVLTHDITSLDTARKITTGNSEFLPSDYRMAERLDTKITHTISLTPYH